MVAKRMVIGALAVMTLVMLAGCAAAQPQPKAEVRTENTITVSGIGEATSAPDLAYVNLGVRSSGTEVVPAVEEANRIMSAVVQALEAQGIAERDMQTTGFNIWSEEQFRPEMVLEEGEPTEIQVRYRVENSLRVKVREIEKLAEIIQAGLDAGANQVAGITFDIEDASELEKIARASAVEELQARAADLAEKMGLSLGDVLAVSEGSQSVPMMGVRFLEREEAVGGGGPPISVGEMTVTVQVTAVFEIER